MSINDELAHDWILKADLDRKTIKAIMASEDEILDDEDIKPYTESLDSLTDHAVESRYPGDYVEPEREEAEEALRIASEIFEIVKRKLGL